LQRNVGDFFEPFPFDGLLGLGDVDFLKVAVFGEFFGLFALKLGHRSTRRDNSQTIEPVWSAVLLLGRFCTDTVLSWGYYIIWSV
jgi:hypothetical protein